MWPGCDPARIAASSTGVRCPHTGPDFLFQAPAPPRAGVFAFVGVWRESVEPSCLPSSADVSGFALPGESLLQTSECRPQKGTRTPAPCIRNSASPFAFAKRPSLHRCAGGTARGAIHGPTRLSRHSCRSSFGPAFGCYFASLRFATIPLRPPEGANSPPHLSRSVSGRWLLQDCLCLAGASHPAPSGRGGGGGGCQWQVRCLAIFANEFALAGRQNCVLLGD